MKIKIVMKHPDALFEACREAVLNSLVDVAGLTNKEKEELVDSRTHETVEACSKFVEYQEYITVEIDTDAQTAIVVPVKS